MKKEYNKQYNEANKEKIKETKKKYKTNTGSKKEKIKPKNLHANVVELLF
jgi:hypothetical protein